MELFTISIRKNGVLMASALLFFGAMQDGNAQPKMEISGMGVASCASYVLALNEARPTSAIKMGDKTYLTEAGAYTQWIVGFINAIRWTNESAEIHSKAGGRIRIGALSADVNAIALSVKKHCEENPDISIFRATTDYINRNID